MEGQRQAAERQGKAVIRSMGGCRRQCKVKERRWEDNDVQWTVNERQRKGSGRSRKGGVDGRWKDIERQWPVKERQRKAVGGQGTAVKGRKVSGRLLTGDGRGGLLVLVGRLAE